MASKKIELDFFAFQWSVEEDNEYTIVRCYGFDKTGKSVFVKVEMTPYCYVELPTHIDWTEQRVQLLTTKFGNMSRKIFQPIHQELIYRRKLYYAWKEPGKKKNIYKDKEFPFLFMSFVSTSALRNFSYLMKKEIDISGIGRIQFNLHEHEAGISPVLKLQALRKLPSAGMIHVKGINIPEIDRQSSCDFEISCSDKDLISIDSSEILHPRVLSFDIEANSTITSAMPDANRPNDKVFQIGMVTLINGKRKKILYSLGNPDSNKVGMNVELKTFKNEGDLLVAFTDYIQAEKINVIIGYNILGWDFQYMISRASYNKCYSEFDMMSVLHGEHSQKVSPQFESKAYTAQKLIYLDAEGRLFIDLLPCIKRSHKLKNYRLKTVTTHFGLPTKDPFTPQDIFRSYREFTPESLGNVGRYCVKDAYITLLLYEKLQMWYGMCEMAKTAHVPIFYLISKGTQIQMFSQVLEHCMYNNYVIISNGYTVKEGDEYMGAIVLNPVPGKYKKVISFDFASLYPSIIMAHNIDYATLIPEGEMYLVDSYDTETYLEHWNIFPCHIKISYIDLFNSKNNKEEWELARNRSELQTTVEMMKEKYPGNLVAIFAEKSFIPDEHCHVFCYTEHSSCSHDNNRKRLKNGEFSKAKAKIVCGQRYYRFIKSEYGGHGVVPTLLNQLISKRKSTREDIKKNDKEIRSKLVSLIKGGGDDCVNFLKEYEFREKKYFEDIDKDVQKLIEKQIEEKINTKELIDRIEYLDMTNKIFDQRQAAYKVCANSMYGAMGVKKGYLPLMPGASSVTYKGRRSIEFISTHIPEKYNGVCVYGDSVSGDTPILVRYPGGTVDVRVIEDLGIEWVDNYRNTEDYERKENDENNEIKKEQSICNDLEVWVDGKWSKIKRVIRHRAGKKMFRVLTHTGCVDVTEDHSLLTHNGDEIKPQELIINKTKLLHSFPNTFEEFVFLSKKHWIEDDETIKLKCLQCLEFKDLDKFYNRTVNTNRHQKDNKCILCCRKNHEDRVQGFIHIEDKHQIEDVNVDEAYVWGLFMAEGSCGTYYCASGNKHSWAINNQDYELLEKCQKILKDSEGYDFKILDTMESSNVYKLVPVGCTKYMVLKYRDMFYYGEPRTGENSEENKAYKKVPHIIFNSSREIRESFFAGWYEGDGEKKGFKLGKNFRFDCKGKIGCQGLLYLAKSLGYKNISINNQADNIKKHEVYRITGSNNKFRKDPIVIKKIDELPFKQYDYVYDLETEEGVFQAGIGELIVKNTDSSHIYFPWIKNNEEAVDLAEKIVDEIQVYFPKPMKLEFEKIYEKYIILTKKRYMCRVANKKGEIIDFIKKGVMLSRRDNCKFAIAIYLKTAESLLDDVSEEIILNDVIDGINSLFHRIYKFRDFVITKSMARAEYKNKTLPAHVQLAYKMRERGIEVPVGARIEYIFTTRCMDEKKFAQGDKVEDVDYFARWRQYLRVDYLYYLEKQLLKPLDELLEVGLGVKDFVKTQYNLRYNKWCMMERIKELSSVNIECVDNEKIQKEVIPKNDKKEIKNVKNPIKKKPIPIEYESSEDELEDDKIIISQNTNDNLSPKEKYDFFL